MAQNEKFARVCDVTGQGMNEGWIADDIVCIKYEQDALNWAIEQGYADLQEAYDEDAIYWTEWEDEDEYEYIEIDGVLTEIN